VLDPAQAPHLGDCIPLLLVPSNTQRLPSLVAHVIAIHVKDQHEDKCTHTKGRFSHVGKTAICARLLQVRSAPSATVRGFFFVRSHIQVPKSTICHYCRSRDHSSLKSVLTSQTHREQANRLIIRASGLPPHFAETCRKPGTLCTLLHVKHASHTIGSRAYHFCHDKQGRGICCGPHV